jgi:hypothetical protein
MTADPGAPRDQEEVHTAPRGPREVPPVPRDSRGVPLATPLGQQEMTIDELLRRLEADGDLTDAELTALARLDGGPNDDDDDDAWDGDLEDELPADWDCDPDPDGDAEPDEPPAPAVPEAYDAGFTHREGGDGDGFAAGGPLDVMLPGPDLARHVGQARRQGWGALSDDELIGVLSATQRLSSWQAEMQASVVAELDARRAGPDGREGEHVAEEVAASLTLTGRSADTLLELSRRLERLPATRALLAAGVIDRARAVVIADQLALLPGADAAAVEERIAPRAGGLTTGQLRAVCQRAVLAHDPQAAIRRREKAEQDARVECWAEGAGTAAIAGRDLAPAGVIAADKTLDADARWLRERGVPGTHDQLRARAMVARLTGQPLSSLLPQTAADPASRGSSPDPAAPGSPRHWPAGPAGPASLGGSVNLTMPAAAWLGLTDSPGEIAGTGAADAGTCRDLAAALAARNDSRWCLTLTDRRGRAVAHGCARAGPGPPGSSGWPGTPGQSSWLAQIKVIPIESGICAHTRESAGYRPSPRLRHLIKIRDRRCGYPGCRRPAESCDDDHTIPFHRGGKTCECNLYPLCRRHHQAKQESGWHLSQPEPGELTWTAPSGRRYTVTAEPYPV